MEHVIATLDVTTVEISSEVIRSINVEERLNETLVDNVPVIYSSLTTRYVYTSDPEASEVLLSS